MSRKNFSWILLSALMIFSILISACTPTVTATPTEEVKPEPTQAEVITGKQQVEVFSWWTGGGEAAGLEAMIKVFNAKNPDIEFINAAVAGGAGTNARAVLATRLQAGDAPDSWQGHAGQELIGT
ncbi:MAG: carbohydrate ABC transporter substrate-binding protein, partial [Anaerolineales bacterium]|nr:carbohydrate ABC transporter substrate-binding protein [Anaerolineales bacterium]